MKGLVSWCLFCSTCQGSECGRDVCVAVVGGWRRGLACWGLAVFPGLSFAPCLLPHRSPFPTVQPDPPVNITVSAVDRNPRWLSVTWQDPPSWNSYYYRLQFELRYRTERSETFTTLMVNFSFTLRQ